MTKCAHSRAARAWVLAPLLVLSGLARPAWASYAVFEQELQAALGTVPPELTQAIDALSARRVPSDVLERKLREGIAKRVPGPRIGETLARVAVGLMWVEDQLAGCRTREALEARDALRTLAADLLLGGVQEAQLGPVMARACAHPDPAAWAAEIGELYFQLVNRLGADRADAWQLTLVVVDRPDAQAGVGALVACLQDIYRARSSIERPVRVALDRLRAGASVRRVRLELEEQFLR